MKKEYEIKFEPITTDDIYEITPAVFEEQVIEKEKSFFEKIKSIFKTDNEELQTEKVLVSEEIKKFIQKGVYKEKWNIYYYEDEEEVGKEFYSYDGINSEHIIKPGYKAKQI